ncbi:phd finger [Olea europaea subsp. europaea]|uniref:Phd finger n=1 Tax=Olea europaea subsp. europaea TaxID=158383 RepID=A0A8S0QD27_OLEEU|nr:phd finger [Olea europaea subsp. europaea]
MKSGSHRLPTSDPHEDWVDGSWTVDCVCGVNFDDGEEMVKCDECGVWVHTRCSRYVKSDKSFACDKCKTKNSASVRNESEETEVAQFLVELPTKTLRMDNPASVSTHRPFRLWTDIPIEERVHVQGVPGGDPGLFSGAQMSSIFGPHLWKATGYVPKKFNFQYREFPLWDDNVLEGKEDKVHKKGGDQNGNQVDDGAGVLYSLSKEKEKENILPTPVVDSIGVKSNNEEGKQQELLSPKQMTERSMVQPTLENCEKHEKKELKNLDNQHAKKMVGKIEKEGNSKKRAVLLSHAASTFSSNGKQLEFSEDRNSKTFNVDCQGNKNVLGDQVSNGLCDSSTDIASREQTTLRNDSSGGAIPREDDGHHQGLVRSDVSFKANVDVASLVEHHDSQSNPVKEEVVVGDLENLGDIQGVGTGSVGISLHDREPVAGDVQYSNIEIANSLQPDKKLKAEVDVNNHGCFNAYASSPDDFKMDSMRAAVQHPESSSDLLSENAKVNSIISPDASDFQVLDGDKMLDVCNSKDKTNQLQGDTYKSKQEPAGSEGSTGARQMFSGHKHGLKPVLDSSKSSGSVTNHSATSYKRKVVVSVGKSPPTSASVAMSKSSDIHIPAANQSQYAGGRQKGTSESKVRSVKDNASTNVGRDEDKCARLKKIPKEHPRSLSYASKVLQPSKTSEASDSKRAPSDSKDSAIHSSTKEPSVSHVFATPGSGECASSQQTEIVSNFQNKATDSVLPLKGEKTNQPGSQSSSRGNASLLHAPGSSSVSTMLSDEEYALLLHQELNSSPRVTRAPRMRHAGSLPQLTSTTPTSMLMKRTSSSGGKDHGLGSRRKTKDFAKDGSHSSREVDNEAKRPSSRDNRRRDPEYNSDSVSKREADGGAVKGTHSMKTSNSSVSTSNLNSNLSSADVANGQNLSSIRHSPRNVSQEDQEMVGRPTNLTLPGLIAEIMSKGKRMTYEELCNAVVPHWPHLRKHNGERYAYSSHSQAVLDCLRNRSEWARLVDRGPKVWFCCLSKLYFIWLRCMSYYVQVN